MSNVHNSVKPGPLVLATLLVSIGSASGLHAQETTSGSSATLQTSTSVQGSLTADANLQPTQSAVEEGASGVVGASTQAAAGLQAQAEAEAAATAGFVQQSSQSLQADVEATTESESTTIVQTGDGVTVDLDSAVGGDADFALEASGSTAGSASSQVSGSVVNIAAEAQNQSELILSTTQSAATQAQQSAESAVAVQADLAAQLDVSATVISDSQLDGMTEAGQLVEVEALVDSVQITGETETMINSAIDASSGLVDSALGVSLDSSVNGALGATGLLGL